MREIIFRGKRIDTGEWVYGSLLQWKDGDATICANESENNNVLIKHDVNPDTVGQYTGLNYSNGKPIGEDYSAGGKAGGTGKGYSHPEKCTIGMTFEELQETWRLRKHKSGNGGKEIHGGRDNH